MKMASDKELLDWLDKEAFDIALVNDDDGHWAVSNGGWQNVRVKGVPLKATFFIEDSDFYKTARKALSVAMIEWKESNKEE